MLQTTRPGLDSRQYKIFLFSGASGFIKYAIKMGSGVMIYIPNFIKIGSGIQKLRRRGGIHRMEITYA
jgi:hypothetical protein